MGVFASVSAVIVRGLWPKGVNHCCKSLVDGPACGCLCGGRERIKSARWMPWRQEAMKDVARCDKLRGDASDR